MEPEPGEQAALSEIRRLRGDGISMRAIAASLNRSAYQTRGGTPWRLESVARVLDADR